MINFVIEHGDWFFAQFTLGNWRHYAKTFRLKYNLCVFPRNLHFFFNVSNTLQLLVNLLKMYGL